MSHPISSSGRRRPPRLARPRPRTGWVAAFAALTLAGLMASAMVIQQPGNMLDSAFLAHVPRAARAPRAEPAKPAAESAKRAGMAKSAKSATPAKAARHAAPPANASCDIVVPANPLSARGLATPYRLTGPHGLTPAESGCRMANSARLGAFVQATILNPATGALSVYEPLVVTRGTPPAAAPVVPRLPAHAVVTIDIGFNGTDLTQLGATRGALRQGHCVNGLPGSVFGQVSFCNGAGFFAAAFRAEKAGRLVVPRAGVSPKTGQACPATRSFDLVDQDPSDNVTSTYLLTPAGRTAQFNAANAAGLPRAKKINNGSDNELLDAFIDPALHCAPFEAPDLSRGGTPGTSQALDELAAAANQRAPVALVPENDEMTRIGNRFSTAKTNLYRSSVGQGPVSAATNLASSPSRFCQNLVDLQAPFLQGHQALLAAGATPVPAVGDNLFTFMAHRLSMSFVKLGCRGYGLFNPVRVTAGRAGAAVAAAFKITRQQARPRWHLPAVIPRPVPPVRRPR